VDCESAENIQILATSKCCLNHLLSSDTGRICSLLVTSAIFMNHTAG